MVHGRVICLFVLGAFVGLDSIAFAGDKEQRDAQYQFEDISVPAAAADEPVLAEFDLARALEYAEKGAVAWSKSRNCVTCHTNGTYMVIRPALTSAVGKPSEEMRAFFVGKLEELKKTDREKLRGGIQPTLVAYVAAGLAEWDAHVAKALSPETDEALRLMFEIQADDGSWANTDCWPPFESDAYHGTTVAAMAVATAPGWLESLKDDDLLAKVERLKSYFRSTPPPHDYSRVLLLWTATRLPGLIDDAQKQELVDVLLKHQRDDGGWSLRTFAAPEKWGKGNRAEKLRSEPEFNAPPSDGHQSGLAVIVLRDAGVPADDARIQRAVKWLLTNQRESGRWWTRSLNTDNKHFITYSGTLYPLLALAKCGALPAQESAGAGK